MAIKKIILKYLTAADGYKKKLYWNILLQLMAIKKIILKYLTEADGYKKITLKSLAAADEADPELPLPPRAPRGDGPGRQFGGQQA